MEIHKPLEELHGRKSIELDSVEIAAAIFGNCTQTFVYWKRSSLSRQSARADALASLGDGGQRPLCAGGMLLLIENHTPLEMFIALPSVLLTMERSSVSGS